MYGFPYLLFENVGVEFRQVFVKGLLLYCRAGRRVMKVKKMDVSTAVQIITIGVSRFCRVKVQSTSEIPIR